MVRIMSFKIALKYIANRHRHDAGVKGRSVDLARTDNTAAGFQPDKDPIHPADMRRRCRHHIGFTIYYFHRIDSFTDTFIGSRPVEINIGSIQTRGHKQYGYRSGTAEFIVFIQMVINLTSLNSISTDQEI
jgi:hypothetical protein